MKVTLRNLIKDLHFVGPNMWTNDRENAFDFEHMEPAVEMAASTGLQDMELVLSFSNVPGEVHLAMATAAQILSTPPSTIPLKPTSPA